MDIFKRKGMRASQKSHHHDKMSISIDEKEQDAQNIYSQEKEAIRQGDARDPSPLNLFILWIL